MRSTLFIAAFVIAVVTAISLHSNGLGVLVSSKLTDTSWAGPRLSCTYFVGSRFETRVYTYSKSAFKGRAKCPDRVQFKR